MALIKRNNKYYVRYTVPSQMRDAMDGKAQIWKATGTGCLGEAKRRQPRILADIIEQVESQYRHATESSESPSSPSFLFASAAALLAQVQDPNDGMDQQLASEIMFDLRERFLKANEGADQESTFRAARNASAMLSSGGTYVPLSEAVSKHLADLEERGRNRSTLDRKAAVLAAFTRWAGNPAVADVDRALAGRWIDTELKPQDIATSTKEWRLGALKAAWTYFVIRGMAEVNVWERMNALLRESTKGKAKVAPPRPWTQAEIDVLKTVPHSDPIYSVSIIRLHSGIRVEECCQLKVDDIDTAEWLMHIREGKTSSSVRTLPIHPALHRIVEQLIESAGEDGYLFSMKPAGKDKRRSHNFAKRAGRWIRANVSQDRGVTQYTLRHTYAQALRDLGVDRDVIEWTTGHKDQSMLFGTYARGVAIERLREAVYKLDFGF